MHKTSRENKKQAQLVNIIFYLLFLSTTIAYFGYYRYSLENNINVFFLYSRYEFYTTYLDNFSLFLRFLKDFLVVIFILSMINRIFINKRSFFLLFLFIIFILFGTLTALLNKILSIGSFVSGVRAYIYIISTTIYFYNYNYYNPSFRIIRNLVFFGIIANTLVVFEQTLRGTNWNFSFIGKGGYRFVGLYGGVNGLGLFVLSALTFFLITFLKYKKIGILDFISIICIFFLMFSTGSRSVMISIFLLIILFLLEKLKMTRITKIIFSIISILIFIPIIINYSTQYADRGDILEVQLESGRLNILYNLLFNNSIFRVIFGQGFGYGTTTYVLLSEDGVILDGAFNTIISQFGIIGLLIFLYLIFLFYKWVMKSTKHKIFTLGCFFVLILQMFTGNIFEAYTYIFLTVISFYMLAVDVNYDKINNKKKEKT